MTTLSKNSKVLNARSDLFGRLASFCVITPIFIMTGYSWLIEVMLEEGITADNISWVVINCSSLVVMILGSVFMRGHNNRNTLYLEAFFPIVFWSVYLSLGSFLVDTGFHYLAMLLGPVLNILGVMYIASRVKLETKFMFFIGKYIAPLLGKREKDCQQYVISSVSSKGTTNFQMAVLILYTVNASLWLLTSLSYLWVGFVEQVPFYMLNPSEGEKLSAVAFEYYGFHTSHIFLNVMFDWFNTIWAAFMIYHIFNDYVNPDEIGHGKGKVKNYVGHGAKRLTI